MANFINKDNSFIHFLAPTLCGIKPSNLFTMADVDFSKSEILRWEKEIKNQNLHLVAFKLLSNRWMIFAYNSNWIKQILCNELIAAYLYQKGYSAPQDIYKTLEELILRLKNHSCFPHEVGLFLGYPLEDVISFEKNKGQNYKYCGIWKSYSDSSLAESCCNQYRCCSKLCKQWFEKGLSVSEIIKKYKEVAQMAA